MQAQSSGSAGALCANRLELRLLLVIQRRVKFLQRRPDQLDRFQHGVEPRVDGRKPVRRAEALVRLAIEIEDVPGLGAHADKPFSRATLRLVQMQAGLDLAAGPWE